MSTQAVEITNWPNAVCEDEVSTVPNKNWYKLGDYLIDINSIIGISPLTLFSFQIYLTSTSYILVEDNNAKALRLNLIEILEAVFGRAGTIDGCPF